MKKILKGKLCNTESAKCLGEYEYGQPGQPDWFRETLYRSKAGMYFIHGEGNAASPYVKACGDPGEQIRLVDLENARIWAEEKLDGDKYAAAFGSPEETESAPLTVLIQPAARAQLEALKAATGMSFGEIISKAVVEYARGKEKAE